ncbi:uncharacterized protein NPIL_261631 [Nephila pilipes]|uniref:Uncharacterized protein n=1 Tax=Nephila pilipes TaxID=299642 RepID=A0A8X6UU32_NEPPI|nr:uncharacterized protein NPIL_261631 [Nephila pilipes]
MNSEFQDTAQYLWTIANQLSTTCPAASRYYMSNLKRNVDNESRLLKKEIEPSQYCKYCGCIWNPTNHKVRIHPIPSPNCHLKKLLKLEEEYPWRLNNKQKKKLKKFKRSTNKIIYTCNICKKTTAFSGSKKYIIKKPFRAPVIPKVKRKKGDLNAGLFIKIPMENKSQNKQTENVLENKQDISAEKKSSSELNPHSKKISGKMNSIIDILKQNVTPELKSSVRKKNRKTLLSQILNQEEEAKKKKNNLSSFLISL